MTIQENLNTMIEERKDDPEPVVLDKHEVKRLLASSGVPNEQLDEFDEKYESIADEKAGKRKPFSGAPTTQSCTRFSIVLWDTL